MIISIHANAVLVSRKVVRDAVVTDYSDALLIPCSIVETHNDTIKSMGDNKIKVLHKIRKFRRRINLVEWETSHHQLCANDAEQYYTDLQVCILESGWL